LSSPGCCSRSSHQAAAQVLVPATIPLGASVNALYRLEGAAH
jgi:hypothetical protein